MRYKPSRCPDCGENVQMCCCQAWAKYTKDTKKPLTPFQKFWNVGVGTYDMPKSHIAEDAWNAALYTARERLQMYGETAAIELLEILYED